MSLFARITRTAARVIRDITEAPAVARQLRTLRADAPTHTTAPKPAPRPVVVDIDPTNTPDIADIEAAARKYETARTEANAAARLRRQADRVLKRTPSGTYGTVTVERVESSRQTVDLDAVKALFAEHGLGEVPMKRCAPSTTVTFATNEGQAEDAPVALTLAEAA